MYVIPLLTSSCCFCRLIATSAAALCLPEYQFGRLNSPPPIRALSTTVEHLEIKISAERINGFLEFIGKPHFSGPFPLVLTLRLTDTLSFSGHIGSFRNLRVLRLSYLTSSWRQIVSALRLFLADNGPQETLESLYLDFLYPRGCPLSECTLLSLCEDSSRYKSVVHISGLHEFRLDLAAPVLPPTVDHLKHKLFAALGLWLPNLKEAKLYLRYL